MTDNELRLARWCKQTIRNMQALGYGHQAGEPYIMCEGGIVLTQSNTPFAHITTEDWIDLNVRAHGHRIVGAGYVYGNSVPSELRDKIQADTQNAGIFAQAHRESA